MNPPEPNDRGSAAPSPRRVYLYRLLGIAAGAFVLLVVACAAFLGYLNRPIDLSEFDFDLPENADLLLFPREPRPEVRTPERRALLDLPAASSADRRALEYLEELLKLEEQEGRENAMTHYVRSHWLLPERPDAATRDLIEDIVENGWSEKADVLLPVLEAWGPALEEIRKGAALDYARGIGWTVGLTDIFRAPWPDYFDSRRRAMMLCVAGRRLEHVAKPAAAMDEYLTALTMGRDYGAKGSTVTGTLIAAALESIAVERIRFLAEHGDVGEGRLRRTLLRLREIERTNGALTDSWLLEERGLLEGIRKVMEDPASAMRVFSPGSRRPVTVKEVITGGFEPRDIKRFFNGLAIQARVRWNAEQAVPDHRTMSSLRREYLETPWHRPEREELRRKMYERLDETHVLVRMAVPNPQGVQCQYLQIEAALREAQLACALELWRLEHKRYPATIEDLYEPWFDGVGPVDPFGGGAFSYRTSEKGGCCHLWSVGPDCEDDGGVLRYDATNGSVSSGDIF